MKIERAKLFDIRLESIILHIAKESPRNARKLKNRFEKSINNLDYMPYKFRKSYYYDNENIRDLIVQRYTLPYLIDNDNDRIVVLDIFKWEER